MWWTVMVISHRLPDSPSRFYKVKIFDRTGILLATEESKAQIHRRTSAAPIFITMFPEIGVWDSAVCMKSARIDCSRYIPRE